MARYWKQILKPGTFWTPRGPVTFSPEQCREIFNSTRTMLSSGRSIPLPLEHQDLLPEKTQPRSEAQLAADRVRNNTGWVDGEPSILFKPEDHSIWTELDIQDEDVDRKMPIIRYVSPEIRKAFAADGRLYTNVITHIALTTQPVWKEQLPFGKPLDGMACLSTVGSLRFSLGDILDEQDLVQMATGPYFAPKGGIWFRGVFYEKYVPKMILQSVEDEGEEGKKEVQDLLRKINARSGRRTNKDYAAGHQPAEGKSYDPNPQRISASYVQVDHPETAANEGMMPPAGESTPVAVWEDPKTGLTYALESHQRVAQAGLQGHSIVVQRLDAPTYGEAAQIAFLSHALDGNYTPKNLVHFLRNSKYPGELIYDELKAKVKDQTALEHAVHEADHIAQLPDHHFADWASGKLTDEQALAIARDHQSQEDEPAPKAEAKPEPTSPEEAPGAKTKEGQEAKVPAGNEGPATADDPQGEGGPEAPGGGAPGVGGDSGPWAAFDAADKERIKGRVHDNARPFDHLPVDEIAAKRAQYEKDVEQLKNAPGQSFQAENLREAQKRLAAASSAVQRAYLENNEIISKAKKAGGIEVESVTGGTAGEFEYPPDSPLKKLTKDRYETVVGGVRYFIEKSPYGGAAGWNVGKVHPDGHHETFDVFRALNTAKKHVKETSEADRAENEKRRDADLAYRRKKAQGDNPPDDSAGIKPPPGEAQAKRKLVEAQESRSGMAGFPPTPGVKGVKKSKDFQYNGLYEVTLDNGDVHNIYHDKQSDTWRHDDPRDRDSVGGDLIATGRNDALGNLVKNADKFKPQARTEPAPAPAPAPTPKPEPEPEIKPLAKKSSGVNPARQGQPDLDNGKKVYQALFDTAVKHQTSNPFEAAAHFDKLSDQDVRDALAHLDSAGIHPPGTSARGKTGLRLLSTAQHFAAEHLAAQEKARLEKSARDDEAAAAKARTASSRKRPRKPEEVKKIKGRGRAKVQPGYTSEPAEVEQSREIEHHEIPKFDVRPGWAPDYNDTDKRLGSEAHKNEWLVGAMRHHPDFFQKIGADPTKEPTPQQGIAIQRLYENSYPGEYEKVDLSHNGGSFFMALDFEKKDDDKLEKEAPENAELEDEDEDEDEDEEDEDEKEESSEGSSPPSGGGGKNARLKEALRLMQKFNVHLHEDKVKTADDFVEETISVLHALEKAGLAAGGGGEPDLEEETPASGAISMSANKTDTAPELDAIKARMSTLEATNAVLKNVGTTERLRNIHSTISQMVKTGRCSKAKADAWLEKLGKHRLSLLDESLPLEIVQVYAAIEEAKDNPAGTFLPAGERERLSVNGNLEDVANPTPSAPPGEQPEMTPDQVAAISRELFDTGLLAGSVK